MNTGGPLLRRPVESTEDALRDEAVRERVSRLESIIEASGVGTWEWNVQSGRILCNERWAQMLGYTLAELQPLDDAKWRTLTHPDDLQECARQLELHFAGKLPGYDCECRLRHKDGHWVWMLARGRVCSRTVDGQPLMMLGTQTDVTLRKQAEDALRQSEAFLNTIYRNSDLGIFVIDVSENGEFRYSGLNPAQERLIGLTNAEWAGKSPRELGPLLGEEVVEYVESLYERCVRDRAPVESEFFAPTGSAQGWWFVWLTPIFAEGGGRVIRLIGSSTPIDSRKRAEQALRDSEERLRVAVQASNVGLWDWELGTDRVHYSREWKAQLGYEEHEIMDDLAEWETRVHPADLPETLAKVQRYLAEPMGPYEAEFRLRHKDGSWRWIYVRAELMCDPGGRPLHFLGCHVDVTERRQLEEQLRHSQRMEAIGQLAGGVAHDFNNLLTVIQGNTELLRYDAERLTPEHTETLSELIRATERAAVLTRQLLTFGRRQRLEARPLDLNGVVHELFSMLQRLLGEDVRLRLELAPDPLSIHADPALLEQVLVNLSVNARDAMPRGGLLRVETSQVEIRQGDSLPPEARPGPHARLSVSDTGCGIAPELLQHIFEPFFTTKEVGKGTGLGLATVFGIVQQHGGWVSVTSEVGRGSCFEVFLPLLTGAGTQPRLRPSAPPMEARRGSELILVVEDEEPVCRLVQRVLSQAGYRVVTAGSGAEALQLLEGEALSVNLVLTDLVMPGGVSGQDLGRRLRELQPELTVLYMSGYAGESGAQAPDRLRLHPGARLLSKPFTPASLLDGVRACLDAH